MTSTTVTVTSDTWVSLNDLSDVSVGNEFYAMNCGNNDIFILKVDQPSSTEKYGAIMTSKSGCYAYWTFESGDDEVWVKACNNDSMIYVFD